MFFYTTLISDSLQENSSQNGKAPMLSRRFIDLELSKELILRLSTHAFGFFVGKLLPKWEGPYVIEEVYHSGAIKINNAEGTNPKVVNGQRIKHYISGTPINVESNIIQTLTPEEHIKESFRNTPES